MASTSASSVQKSFKYDVFLSFRGEDTRKTFVDHLYLALVNKGIITYKDDETIEKGERISEQLMRSVEESRFYIIVFSKTYASSSWCLEELVKIMECQKMTEHTAYPIFYDVEPTEVRHQNGAVGDAFAKLVAKHEKVSGERKRTLEDEKKEDVGRWRNALKEAASLAGMELKNTFNGHEAKFIQQIVEKVSLKLHFFTSSIDGNLVGMETRVKDVVSSLEIDSNDVRMIGMNGMGGGGKTTLARAIFDYISIQFKRKSFVENVREISNDSLFGLKNLQQLVLRNALNDQSINVPSVSDGKNMIKRMMGSRKILLVLDDVDKIDQLEALAGDPTWFKPGSRVIITTRDKQVLKAHRVNFIHDVNLLSNEEAIDLFNKYAFRREIPNQGYQKLSRKIVHYAAGLPLTIKVLGSFLYGRIEGEWEDTIERLKTIPLKETLEKLELSYNGLESDQKEIFLDIVCILKGEKKEKAIKILESCGFRAKIGLGVLEQKSLISISHYEGRLLLHDHIEEMGKNIVRRLHPHEPKRHSRLWIKDEIEDILFTESGTEETKCIKVHTDLSPAIVTKGLRKLKGLRFLNVEFSNVSYMVYVEMKCIKVSQVIIMKGLRKLKELRFLKDTRCVSSIFDEGIPHIPDSLQYLEWLCYPFMSLPKSFQGNKLVSLVMRWSRISKLCKGKKRKVFNNLKFIDLSDSRLLRTFDLTVAPQLEELNLDGCSNLVELQFPIECSNLKVLILGCFKVRYLNLGLTPNLEKLSLYDCEDFVELQLPVECPNLNNLSIMGSKVSNLNLGLIPNLEKLYLNDCQWLQKVHAPVGCLKKIVKLQLYDCSSFKEFTFRKEFKFLDDYKPYDLTLTVEYVDTCPLHPENKLPAFKFRCIYEKSGSSLSGNLEKLISSASGLCACKNLEYLFATICGLQLQYIRKLELEGSIPGDQWQLPENISRLGCLEELHLKKCGSLRGISNSPMKCLKRLHIYDCYQVEKLTEELECLEELYIHNCFSLREVTNIGKMKCLKLLHLSNCHQVERLPEALGDLECLVELYIWRCTSLRDIPNNICKLKCLEYLSLSYCEEVEKLPEELGHLECLKKLDIYRTDISRLPKSITQLKGLRIIGSEEQLQSYGFTSETEIRRVSLDSKHYYVKL